MAKLKYCLARMFMKTIGQTSDGIRLSHQEGLTSGKMLDYIYKNQPRGSFLIGKAIDRMFLNDPGWQAVRTRRQNLETLIVESIDNLRRERKPVVLLDIASGPADYILAVLERVAGHDVQALCQDFEARWVEEGKRKAEARHIKNVKFQQGDAFKRKALMEVQPRPNVIVSSGFYDWLTDDMVNMCHENLKKQVGLNAKYETDISTVVKHGNKSIEINGRIDAEDDDCIWEFECTNALTLEHKLQLLVYAFLKNQMQGTTVTNKKFRLMNVRTGEILKLNNQPLLIDQVMELLFQNKFDERIRKTDDEFIAECANALCVRAEIAHNQEAHSV